MEAIISFYVWLRFEIVELNFFRYENVMLLYSPSRTVFISINILNKKDHIVMSLSRNLVTILVIPLKKRTYEFVCQFNGNQKNRRNKYGCFNNYIP